MTRIASYANGFAPRDGQPRYPSLWKGCVGAWAPSLGPTGLTLRDWSGRENHAAITNGPAWSVASGHQCIVLDGSDDYADCVRSAYSLGIRRYATFAGFIAVTTFSGSFDSPLISDWNSSNGINLRIDSMGTSATFYVYPNNHRITFSHTFSLGVRYHLAGVMDGANMHLYINGAFVASTTLGEDVGASASSLKIGRRGDLDVYGILAGRVTELRVYDRALSAKEIQTLSLRPGIAHELAPRRRASAAVQFNRRRRLLVGA